LQERYLFNDPNAGWRLRQYHRSLPSKFWLIFPILNFISDVGGHLRVTYHGVVLRTGISVVSEVSTDILTLDLTDILTRDLTDILKVAVIIVLCQFDLLIPKGITAIINKYRLHWQHHSMTSVPTLTIGTTTRRLSNVSADVDLIDTTNLVQRVSNRHAPDATDAGETPTTPHGHPLRSLSRLPTPLPLLAIMPLCVARVAEGLIYAVILREIPS